MFSARNYISHVASVLVVLLPTGCSFHSDVKVKVFVVTKGGENIKLGLVTVNAIPYTQATDAIRKFLSDRDAKLAGLQAQLDRAEQQFKSQSEDRTRQLEAAEQKLEAAEQKRTPYEKNADEAAKNLGQTCYAASKKAEQHFYQLEKTAESVMHKSLLEKQRKQLEQGKSLGLPHEEVGAFVDKWHEKQKTDYDFKRLTNLISTTSDAPETAVSIVSKPGWNCPELINERARVISSAQVLSKAVEELSQASDVLPPLRMQVQRIRQIKVEDNRNTHHDAIADLLRISRVYGVLPSGTYSAKTDADGECTLQLPRTERWVLAAAASRQAGGVLEEYLWVVEVPSGVDSVVLSNDNLLGVSPLKL